MDIFFLEYEIKFLDSRLKLRTNEFPLINQL